MGLGISSVRFWSGTSSATGAPFELILPVASGIISTFVDRARAMKQVPVREWSDR